MALNTWKMYSNGIKIAFFQKITQTPVCDTFELQHTSLLKHVFQFRHFRILTFGLSPFLERVPSCVPTGHGF